MMERILKRIGLHGGKKVAGEKQEHVDQCDEERGRDSDSSPVFCDRVQCDLLSFRSAVCAAATSADSDVENCGDERRRDAGNNIVIQSQLVGNDEPGKRNITHGSSYYQRKFTSRILNFHYLDLHRMEFRPGALRKRLCGVKKHDNELYRSNSFKFERFERSEEAGTFQNQTSLCDDYSIPVDFVNKQRPHSFGANLINWTIPSPSGDPVEIVAAYCDPRDSKSYLEPGEEASGKLYTTPDRDYSQPYTADNSLGSKSSNSQDDGVYEDVGLPRDPPLEAVNKSCITVIRVGDSEDDYEEELGQAFQEGLVFQQPVRRNPSPYYYGDLFRAEIGQDCNKKLGSYQLRSSGEESEGLNRLGPKASPRLGVCRKSVSLDTPNGIKSRETNRKDDTVSVDQVIERKVYRKSVSLDTPAATDLSKKVIKKTDGSSLIEEHSVCVKHHDVCVDQSTDSLLAACLLEWDSLMPPLRELRGHGLPSSCNCTGGGKCVTGNREDIDDVIEERITRLQRQQIRNKLNGDDGLVGVEPEVDYDTEGEEEFDDMSGRQRRVYETAFDCKVSRSDDDLDDVDRVTNHPSMHSVFGNSAKQISVHPPKPGSSQELGGSKDRRIVTLVRGKLVKERPKSIPNKLIIDSSVSSATLSRDLDDLELDGKSHVPLPNLALRGLTSSPPSTAPLPTKFHGKAEPNLMSSIKSAPNLPFSSPGHPRLKDLRLPVKSLRAREDARKGIGEFKERPRSFVKQENNVEEHVRPRSMFQECESIFSARPKEENNILEIKGRPRNEVSGLALDFSRTKMIGKETKNILEIKGRPHRKCGVHLKFSSTESMATSSSGGSLESIRSSTSEGNRSTSSSESQHSTSLSSHSSDSVGSNGSSRMNLHNFYNHPSSGTPLAGLSTSRFFAHQSNKLHILSPISDKSSIEPASETSDNNRNNNSQKASPEENEILPKSPLKSKMGDQNWAETSSKVKRRSPQNKNIINLSVLQSSMSGEAEVQGSDSGISIESRGTTKHNKGYSGTGFAFLKIGLNNTDNKKDQQSDLSDLPFDMPKLRRRRMLEQDTCTSGSVTSVDLHDLPFDMPKLRHRVQQETGTSGSATSVDLHELPFDMPKLRRRLQPDNGTSGSATSVDLQDLPFDMPKLRRRLRCGPQTTQLSVESSGVSHTSSSQSVVETDGNQTNGVRPSLTLNLQGTPPPPPKQLFGLNLQLGGPTTGDDAVDVQLPLERQGWYHGAITRLEAESVLRLLREGSYLVRNSETTRLDYSLSLKSARGFMHMRIQPNKETGTFILGQFSKPFDNIPAMIRHYSVNRLPIRGAEHMCLLHPVIEQLL